MYLKISGTSNPKQKKQSGDAVTRKFKKKALKKENLSLITLNFNLISKWISVILIRLPEQ